MTNQIDPVQGLVDYTLEVKPFHSKIVEVLVSYVHSDFVGVSISDAIRFNMIFDMDYALDYCPTAGYGVQPYGDYYRLGQPPDPEWITESYPIDINIIAVDTTASQFLLAGDARHFFNNGNSFVIQNSTHGINGDWFITGEIVYDSTTHTSTVAVSHILSDIADGYIYSGTQSYDITRVDTTNKLFAIPGNIPSLSGTITVMNSTANDGVWIITSSYYHVLEDATILSVEFVSITTHTTPIYTTTYQITDGYIQVFEYSNFDLPIECPTIAPNTARTTFVENLEFVLGSTLQFNDDINVSVLEPSGIIPWSGGLYGWDIGGWNTVYPSFITLHDYPTDVLSTSIKDSLVIDGSLVLVSPGVGTIGNIVQSSITDSLQILASGIDISDAISVTMDEPIGGISWNDSHYGWDEVVWDDAEGFEWDLGAANTNWRPPFIDMIQNPGVELIANASIVDSLSVSGNSIGAFDYQQFDVGSYDQ
jgi:hypothetical protein